MRRRSCSTSEERDAWLVAATALAQNPSAAIAIASSLRSGAARNQIVDKAGSVLFLVRRYDLARALFTHTNALTANTPQAPMLHRMKVASRTKLGRDPKQLAFEVSLAAIDPSYKSAAIGDADYVESLQRGSRQWAGHSSRFAAWGSGSSKT